MTIETKANGIVHWTSSNRQYSGAAEVVKVNVRSLRARLLAPVPSKIGGAPYPEDHEIVVPIPGTPFNFFEEKA